LRIVSFAAAYRYAAALREVIRLAIDEPFARLSGFPIQLPFRLGVKLCEFRFFADVNGGQAALVSSQSHSSMRGCRA